MPKLIARWNPARDVWETETTGLFCEHSDVFSETWPVSGMTRGGVAYELPTSAHRTDGSASSSLLPTPDTGTTPNGHGRRGGSSGNGHQSGGSLDVTVVLLQTPSVADALGGHLTRGGDRSNELLLPGQVQALLPTPRTSDTNGAGQHGQGGMDLRTVVSLLPGASTNPPSDDGNT